MSGAVTTSGPRVTRLPVWILIGAVAGILTGITVGERAAILQPVGSAYAMLLQVAVYPYLICSLLSGLGRLAPSMARQLLRASWSVYLFMWVVTLGGIWGLAWAIPSTPLPSMLTPDPLTNRGTILDLLIPANLFTALGQNYVPAVVVFAVVYGIAIQKVQRKAALFEVLDAIQVASVTFWGWVVRFAPIGVFGLFAAAAGTIQPDRLGGLLLYVGLFLIGSVVLAFAVFPLMLSAVAPIGYRELLREVRPALVLALVTTLSVVALPFVQNAAERVAARAGCPEGEERTDVIKASLSICYVLGQLGNYFTYLLILYASFLYQVRLTLSEQLILPIWTLMSGLGSPTATVDGVIFLGNWLRLPGDLLPMFLETWTVTRYGQVALSVMGFSFATILVPLIYFGKARIAPVKGIGVACVSVVLLGAVTVGGIALRPMLVPAPRDALLPLTLDPALAQAVPATVHRVAPADSPPRDPNQGLSGILGSGVLRVGYNTHVIPFSYLNAQNDLVGFDIAFAYRLARDLNLRLELIPFTWQGLANDLVSHRFDIAIGGIYITAERLKTLTVSQSYYQSPLALIVSSDRASEFLSRAAILAKPGLRLASFDDPILVPLLKRVFPDARLEVVPDYSMLPAIKDRVDGAFWTLQQAGAWAASHPGFTAVGPADMGTPILFAYLMPPGAESIRQYLDQWLVLKANDGFRQAQIDYWIKGIPREEVRPRWNLIDALFSRSDRTGVPTVKPPN